MKLRTRITLIICFMIIVLMTSLGAMIYIKSASILDRSSEEHMVSQLDRVQENIDLLVRMNKLETRELALDKMVQAFLENKISPGDMNKYLINSMEKKNKTYSYYMDFFILDKSGRIIASCMPSAMNIDLSKRKYFINSVKTRATVTSDILVGKANGQLIVNTVSPVINLKGDVLGYAATAIYAEYFSKIAEDLRLGESGYYAIVDSENLILSHPNKDLIGKESVFNVNHEAFRKMGNGLIKHKPDVNDHEKEFQIFKLMKNTNWILVASIPEVDIYSQSRSLLYSVLLIGIIAIIFSMLIGVYITKRISIPIVAMTEYLDVISKGSSAIDKSISESIEILKENYKEVDEAAPSKEAENSSYDEIGRFQTSFKETKKIFYHMLSRYEKESRQLIKSSEQLAATIEDISNGTGKFISTLSHDLKNSITVIKGYASGLKAGIIKDEAVKEDFINGIYARTEELERIIYDVLDSAYEAKANMKIYKEKVDLKNFALELSESAKEYVKSKSLNFESNIDIKVGTIYIDKTKIKRVWNNLINNAVKYSSEGSRVVINIVQELDRVRFEVQDEGIGIKQNEVDKIFDMFYRGSNTKVSGYGLGLFISKSIVEAHGSELNVKPGGSKGSVFWFYIGVKS
jgi:signal transduction histidine kinase